MSRAVADLAAGVILASVEIKVPAERVFRAISDPRELMNWWGTPDTYRAHRWEADFRVGGQWVVEGKSVEGRAYSVKGEFVEIDPPRRIVQTWEPDWEPGPPTTITYTLDAIDGGTRLTVRHEGFGARTEACARHAQGWDRILGWLHAHLVRP